MYKLKYGLDNLDGVVNEMLALGHDANANPNLIPFLKDYNKSVKQVPNLNLSPGNISLVFRDIMKTKHFVNSLLKETNLVKSTRLLINRYPELKWLTGDINATPEGKVVNTSFSISENYKNNFII